MIDYEALMDAYRRSLTSVLRGFRPGEFAEPFLETWVPDEDDVKSVRGIFEAASGAKVPRLALKIGAPTLARAPVRAFEEVAGRFGKVSTSRDGQGVILDVALVDGEERSEARVPANAPAPVHRPHRAAPSPPVPPMSERAAAYDEAIRAIGPFTHEGSVPADEGTAIAIEHQGATLEVAVDAQRVLVAARHRGGAGDVPAVLEALCRTIESLPLREAVDHGPARLELALRGRAGARVVPGIVSPANADPRISACVVTLRALLAEYARRAGAIEVKNEFVPPLRAAWGAASPAEREARVSGRRSRPSRRISASAKSRSSSRRSTAIRPSYSRSRPTSRRRAARTTSSRSSARSRLASRAGSLSTSKRWPTRTASGASS